MHDVDTVRVALGERSYDIQVGPALIATAGREIRQRLGARRAVVVTDEIVARYHLESLMRSLELADMASEAIVVPPGEGSKSFEEYGRLMEALLGLGIDRGTAIVALGGGVIGDLAGFAAATALRGLPFVQVPTTLLAQVDSSVGGKTGINTTHGKNLIGAFHQPSLVLADTDTLDSLPRRERLAGYAEIVKYGLLGDANFFAWLEDHGLHVVEGIGEARRHAVVVSCRMKADIVGRDERETGERALLNLGHTFAHAIEAELGYDGRVLHGEAVAIGMVMAFELSAALELCPTEDGARLRRHLAAVGLPTDLSEIDGAVDWSRDALLSHMAKDKKVRDGRATFILARGIGRAERRSDVDPAVVSQLLDDAVVAWMRNERPAIR